MLLDSLQIDATFETFDISHGKSQERFSTSVARRLKWREHHRMHFQDDLDDARI